MREIKFRGKRVDNGEWWYGHLIQSEGNCYITSNPSIIDCNWLSNGESTLDNNFGGLIQVIPETVGQYTGVNDKHCKEIYKGDIVKCTNDSDEIEEWDSDTGIGAVEWEENGYFWNITKVSNGMGDIAYKRYIKVIGNIHDNPKMLESSDEK